MITGDMVISHYLKKSKTFAYREYTTWNDLWEGNINSDIIINGSSRAWVHIDPAILQKELNQSAYNLGMDGYNFHAQYFRYEELLKYNTQPKVIIQSVEAFTLEKRTDLYNKDQFLPYMLFNSLLEAFTNNYKGFTFADFRIPLVRYFGNRRAIGQAAILLINPNFRINQGRKRGFEGKDRTWNDDLKAAKETMGSYEVTIDTGSLKLFKQYLTACTKNNMQVILVYTPEYFEGQKFIKNREEIIKLFTAISKEYNIPFLDYSNDSLSYNKSYFYNTTHLNKTGAQLFSNKLAKDMKPLIVH